MENLYDAITDQDLMTFLVALSVTLQRRLLRVLLQLEIAC